MYERVTENFHIIIRFTQPQHHGGIICIIFKANLGKVDFGKEKIEKISNELIKACGLSEKNFRSYALTAPIGEAIKIVDFLKEEKYLTEDDYQSICKEVNKMESNSAQLSKEEEKITSPQKETLSPIAEPNISDEDSQSLYKFICENGTLVENLISQLSKQLSEEERPLFKKMIQQKIYSLKIKESTSIDEKVEKDNTFKFENFVTGPIFGSPVTASGEIHNKLVGKISNIVGESKAEFKFFLDSLNDRKYSQAFRQLCMYSAEPEKSIKIAEELLNAKNKIPLDINEQAGDEKLSALHYAAKNKNLKLYQLLRDHGANPMLKDQGNKTALDYLSKSFNENSKIPVP